MLGGVTGGLPDPEAHVFDLDDVPLGDGNVIEGALRRFRRVDRRAGRPREVDVPRDEIGVQVRLDDVGDLHVERFRRVEVDLHVAPGIDDRAGPVSREHVGTVGDLRNEEVFQQHGRLLVVRVDSGFSIVTPPQAKSAYVTPVATMMKTMVMMPPARR